jgi:hypothetical protein
MCVLFCFDCYSYFISQGQIVPCYISSQWGEGEVRGHTVFLKETISLGLTEIILPATKGTMPRDHKFTDAYISIRSQEVREGEGERE